MSFGAAVPILNISYNASVTLARFHASTAFVRGVMGPVGSGKSVGCCAEVMDIARKQWPNAQGVRQTRIVVVRNTSPQLETTTIKTWTQWFPESVFGTISKKAPFTQMIRFKMEDGTSVESEIIFLALDKPEDVKKLLSLECTVIWFNEAREIDKVMLDMATGRVGRYPSMKDKPDNLPEGESWPTRACIIMDTNPPNDDHWWFDYAENDGWRKDPETEVLRSLESIAEGDRWEFFRQPGARTPQAENIPNLTEGYYRRQMFGKDADYIRVMIDAEYGMIQAGKPVYKAVFNKENHVHSEVLPIDSRRPTVCGIDCSGRNPSAIFLQKVDSGQVRVVHELVCEDMGAQLFAKLLRVDINRFFPHCDVQYWGDPAGGNKTQNDEFTYFQILKQHAGITVRPSPVLRIKPRLEAVKSLFLRNVYGGKPAVLISTACKVFISGLSGGYKFRQLQVSGEARHHDEPEKNRYSDVQDAFQYAVCGMGEYLIMTKGEQRHATEPASTISDISDWKVFG